MTVRTRHTQPPLAEQEMIRRGLAGIRPGLERIMAVLETMGRPELAIGAPVLVAGTNGKGSTCAFLEALLRAAGGRVALFTSPHLVDVRERLRLDGEPVATAPFDEAARRVLAAEREIGIELTGFEFVTATALSAAADWKPDVTILEVGMGGRLDATNVVHPALSVITPIALDHARFLGDTLAAIAREKAGILRPGVPAVVARQEPAARAVIATTAAALSTPLAWEGEEWQVSGTDQSLSWHCAQTRLGPARLSLPGAFQLQNAGLAVAAAQRLAGAGLTREVLLSGLATAVWPGRFDERSVGPRRVLFDGAHNPHAMTALANAWQLRYDHRPAALCAIKADKDAAAMVATLSSFAREIICTKPGTTAGHEPESLALLAAPGVPVSVIPDPEEAFARLLSLPGPEPRLCCGSFFLVGYLLAALPRRLEAVS